MRKAIVLFILAVAWASSAHAQLLFTADFARDGPYENSWPMKTDDVVSVDIYVSNVLEPGLIAMGFKLTFDSEKLSVESAGVDQVNWPTRSLTMDIQGEIEMVGSRIPPEPPVGNDIEGVAGNHIHLGTVTFRCIAEGTTEFKMLTRGENVEGFVLDCNEETQNCALLLLEPEDMTEEERQQFEQLLAELIRDGDIGDGVLLATIRPPVPGNINGDGSVDLADAVLALQFMAKMHSTYVHGNADVNDDGVIGMADAVYILQKVSGLRQ